MFCIHFLYQLLLSHICDGGKANEQQCWSANVKVPKALLTEARSTFDSNPDGGHMITTGSIAVRPFMPSDASFSQQENLLTSHAGHKPRRLQHALRGDKSRATAACEVSCRDCWAQDSRQHGVAGSSAHRVGTQSFLHIVVLLLS